MSIELIKRKPITIRVKNKYFEFVKPYYLQPVDELQLIKAKVKGSCIVWNVCGEQVTYGQIKNLVTKLK